MAKDMLADTLREASRLDGQTQNRLIETLAQDPALAIDDVMKAAYTLYSRGPWQLAVRVVVEMGYPRNEQAIKRCIEHVSDDRRTLHTRLYVTILNEIGVETVTPYLIQAMLDTSIYHDPKYSNQGLSYPSSARFRDIEGISISVLPSNIEFARRCGPTVAYLLARMIADPGLAGERSFMLAAFQKLGTECAVYALPALVGMVQQWGIEDEDAREALELIQSFPQEVLEPYRYLLDFLQKPEQEHTTW